jgi:hypothetical protein
LTHGRRKRARSHRCWWVSTTGSMLAFSSAPAVAARAVAEKDAARKSRRFMAAPRARQRDRLAPILGNPPGPAPGA